MTKARTHFEQVPLYEIKSLLQVPGPAAPAKEQAAAANVTVERPEYKTEPYAVRESV